MQNIDNINKSNSFSLSLEKFLYLSFFFVFFFSPMIQISFLPFYMDISDFYCVLLLFTIIKNDWYKQNNFIPILVFFIVSGYIFLTILVNKQFHVLNNYFEIYDLFKLLCFFIFFKEQYGKHNIQPILEVCFLCLVVFNVFHYYNILDFNNIVMPYYCGKDSPHLVFFGYNSLGEPATKRAIGTMGNPNNNALLFLFFLILFAPRNNWSRKNCIYFFIALVVFLCCQSRTGMVAFAVMMTFNYILSNISWKKMLIQVLSILFVSAFVLNFAAIMHFLHIPLPVREMNYSLSLLDSSALKSNSWTERLRIWKELLLMVKDKPIFGFSPNKNYFYENHIYAENEYILMLWRYGIIGLFLYMSLYLMPVWKAIKHAKNSIESKNAVLIISIFAVTALANCPFSNVKMSILMIFVYASFYAGIVLNPNHKDNNTINSCIFAKRN